MGLDYYLIASRKGGKPLESRCFLFERASWRGRCLLSYFSTRLPVRDHDDGTRECRVTPDAWNALMSELTAQKNLILYLSSFVAATYSFDPNIPERYHDLHAIDWRRTIRFDRWFSRTFSLKGAFPESSPLISLTEENARHVIDSAYTLLLCMELDEPLRETLQDPGWEVKLGIG